MTSTAPKMDNIPIVSPQKIATRIGFKIGSIVEVSDAVTGETRSNPLYLRLDVQKFVKMLTLYP